MVTAATNSVRWSGGGMDFCFVVSQFLSGTGTGSVAVMINSVTQYYAWDNTGVDGTRQRNARILLNGISSFVMELAA